MKEICNIVGILCFTISRKVKTNGKKKKICAVDGEGAVTDGMCQKWFVKFRAGDFSLEDAAQSGRPVEGDSDQIETSIENNQHYTMWEIANILKISKSIVTGKNEKCVFYFMENTKRTFQPTQYLISLFDLTCIVMCIQYPDKWF